jgi:predicted nucleic acid-binding protein
MPIWLVVLDTSVLVAALRSRVGASFELLRLLRARRFEIALSVPLALEYEAVLVRHASDLGLRRAEAEGLVDYLCGVARHQEIHFLWRPSLPDPHDEFILELAVAAGCNAIVTHNVRDFAGARRLGMRVLTPSVFLKYLEKNR